MKSVTVSPTEAFNNIEALRNELSQVAHRKSTKNSDQILASLHAKRALAWANLHHSIHIPRGRA